MRRGLLRFVLAASLTATWPGVSSAQETAQAPAAEPLAAQAAAVDEFWEIPGIEVRGERWLEPDEILYSLRKLTAPDRGSRILPRFYSPFCPRVAGVDRKTAAVLEDRIRANAKAAGLFTEPEHCRLNAFVIVLEEPLEMFDRLRNRRPGLFGNLLWNDRTIRSVRDDIKAGKPLVSWNQIGIGWPGIDSATPDFSISAAPGFNFRGETAGRALYTPWIMKNIAVVVLDKNQLGGFDLDQIADVSSLYLIGLPRRNLDFTGVTAPTMLRMFEAGPENAPEGLTEFDRAYLRGILVQGRNTMSDRIGDRVVEVYREECALPDGQCDLDKGG